MRARLGECILNRLVKIAPVAGWVECPILTDRGAGYGVVAGVELAPVEVFEAIEPIVTVQFVELLERGLRAGDFIAPIGPITRAVVAIF